MSQDGHFSARTQASSCRNGIPGHNQHHWDESVSWLYRSILPEQVFDRAKAIGEGHTPGTVEPIAFDPGGKMPGPCGVG
jgi:hypothetical protein